MLRRTFGLTFILLTIYLCWHYMLFGMTMNMEPVSQWQAHDIVMLYVMWAVMMAGMMLPSALPVLLLVQKFNQRQTQAHHRNVPISVFAAGYLLAWCLYSVLVTFLQWGLHHFTLLTPMMDSASQVFSAGIVIVAGFYQFSPLKQRCLQLCRSPMSVVMKGWNNNKLSALSVGFKHGSYCVLCCWFLMALLFVGGVMNISLIIALTLLVILEKTFPNAKAFSYTVGAALIIFGIYLLLQ